jgi:dGTP triphosphohydrolase
MNQELGCYQNALKDQAHPNLPVVQRISLRETIVDPDLMFEGIIDPYEIDQTKILSSKSLRRESSKTQVFFSPDNPHIRNRMTHTHEVTAVATNISQVLGLNTELTKAVALAHDIGHGPAGHLFEQVSQDLGIKFRHDNFGAISAAYIERNGTGLNLTKDTVKGILEHSRGAGEMTVDKDSLMEHMVVMYSDKIAYVFSDINDLQRLGWMSSKDYELINSYFPGTQRDRVNQCIFALIKESAQKRKISFEDSETAKNFKAVKKLMYQEYGKLNRTILGETLKAVFDCVDHIAELQKYDPTLVVALMTDRELNCMLNHVTSSKRVTLEDLKDFGVYEIIENGFLEHATYAGLNTRLLQRMEKLK